MKANKISIIIIRDGEVGKTSVLRYFDKRQIPTQHIKTTGIDYILHKTEVEGNPLEVKLWDTAGQERFRNITVSYFRGAHGIVLVYDVSDRKTFENVVYWAETIKQVQREQREDGATRHSNTPLMYAHLLSTDCKRLLHNRVGRQQV